MADQPISLGVQSFASVPVGSDGTRPSDGAVLRGVVEHGALAEQLGIDAFGLGEHHRDDFVSSSPEVALAAIAARTEAITLSSAVTVLSTDDPVRAYQRWATLDGVSGGRAEPILGRGSFTESFPLFGFALSDYELLFEERLALWAQLRAEQPLDWSGRTRAALSGQSVFPRTERPGGIRTWVGVGGSPESIVRTARYGFDLMLATLGMSIPRLASSIELFERALAQFGHPRPRIGLTMSGHIGESDAEARDELWPHYEAMFSRIGRERGWGPQRRESFEAAIDAGSNLVASPETAAQRLTELVLALGVDRIDVNYDVGTLPHEIKTRSLTLLGTEVYPRVREQVAAARGATSS